MAEAKVISLDVALRLTRANTQRSSSYEAKANRLEPAGAKRLDMLEQHLFDARETLDDCRCGQLGKLERTFDCALGRIWYFFSKPRGRFVLLDFEFGRGGSGGLPVPCEPWEDERSWLGQAAAADRLVAWRRDWPHVADESGSKPLVGVPGVPIRRVACILGHGGDGSGRRSRRALVVRFSHGNGTAEICGREGSGPSLPAWSILSGLVLAREQLENDFARSILFGEALCREATGTSFGRTLLNRSRGKARRLGGLASESASALDLMLYDGPQGEGRFRQLRIARVFRRCLLADDVHLSVVRLELTAHLSIHVVASASCLDRGRDPRRRANSLMRKYALLADFVVLTDRLFEAGRPRLDGSHICREMKAVLGGRSATRALRDLGSLEQALRWLVASLPEGRRSDEPPCDPSALHHRLVGLTKELLEPMP